MIRLRRGSAPEILDGSTCKGALETARAVAAFAARMRKPPRLKFLVYRDPSIKQALNEMTSYKCAYCESSYGAVHPVDVEHYRPKGPFRDADGSWFPGYYWLAATWDNLLPACIDCNRRRTHGSRGQFGKASAFPVHGRRAKKPGEERGERRLLLHPCRDEPEKHLWFLDDGGVIPKRTKTGKASAKGRTSIRVYGLDRPLLVRDRAALVMKILFHIDMTERAIGRLRHPKAGRDARYELRRNLEQLYGYLKPNTEYVALARQFIKPALKKMGIPEELI